MDDKSNSVNYLTEYFVEPTKNLYKGIISGSSGIDLNAITQYAAIFASVFILMLSIGIISSNAVILWIQGIIFGNSVKVQQIRRLDDEIKKTKQAMSRLSQVDDFAKYFRLERVWKHHLKQRSDLVKELGTSQTLFKKLIFISFSISLSLYLLWTYADFPLFYISSKLFIPLNFVIQSPHYTYSTFGGKTTSDLIPISPFNLIIMGLIILKLWSIYGNRSQESTFYGSSKND